MVEQWYTVKYAKEMGRMIAIANLDADGDKKLIEEGYPVFLNI